MCLSIPSKVVSIDSENEMCTVDTMGVKREASLSMMKEGEVKIGDFVLIHIGFVMNTILLVPIREANGFSAIRSGRFIHVTGDSEKNVPSN